MACVNRDKRKRSGEDGLKYVTSLAVACSNLIQGNVDIYIEGLYKNEKLYKFAPSGSSNKEVVKTILWQEKE